MLYFQRTNETFLLVVVSNSLPLECGPVRSWFCRIFPIIPADPPAFFPFVDPTPCFGSPESDSKNTFTSTHVNNCLSIYEKPVATKR